MLFLLWGDGIHPRMPEIVQTVQGAVLAIRGVPGSKHARVTLRAGVLSVCVNEVAEKGKANRAILKLLSKTLDFPVSGLELVSGHTDRRKRVLFRGLEAGQLQVLLESLA